MNTRITHHLDADAVVRVGEFPGRDPFVEVMIGRDVQIVTSDPDALEALAASLLTAANLMRAMTEAAA